MSNLDTLFTYFALLKETLKYRDSADIKNDYTSVDIELPDDFVFIERWEKNDGRFHMSEIPVKDLEQRIRAAKEHLRYLKRKKQGKK